LCYDFFSEYILNKNNLLRSEIAIEGSITDNAIHLTLLSNNITTTYIQFSRLKSWLYSIEVDFLTIEDNSINYTILANLYTTQLDQVFQYE